MTPMITAAGSGLRNIFLHSVVDAFRLALRGVDQDGYHILQVVAGGAAGAGSKPGSGLELLAVLGNCQQRGGSGNDLAGHLDG